MNNLTVKDIIIISVMVLTAISILIGIVLGIRAGNKAINDQLVARCNNEFAMARTARDTIRVFAYDGECLQFLDSAAKIK